MRQARSPLVRALLARFVVLAPLAVRASPAPAQTSAAPAPAAVVPPGAVAVMGGEALTPADVQAAALALGAPAQAALRDPALRRTFVEQLALRTLALKAARAARADADAALPARLAFVRDDVLLQVFLERRAATALTDDRLRAYFAANRPRFNGKIVRAARLVVAERERAVALKERLGDGAPAERFKALARSASQEPNARKTAGDALERRWGDEPPEANTFLFAAAVGTIGGPFAVPGGFALYRIAAVEPGKDVTFEAARADVARLAAAELTSDYLKSLADEGHVAIDAAAVDALAPPPSTP